ncbi:C40 family peptidase [Cellulomonas sp. zg-ZUI222]|uniref:C40 family peptidase n=1 Tax=Cellulomonas wangleii TaxID=2816956 RepID=A0ABX8D6N0_9CELL|nr:MULTISPECIES: NlpC/P60 family protein [Cellulomonas]MBO0901183.1 C40 family peptidase [Cellulomonas sp. zg-ZUI22]MBO0922505.1 C40 family peptidase [Cellulomonas wangleii]MBO0924948.1 C40 family peptidase [Cellulomonas wangleii]MBO0926790.1 C40 family peptidase [Cellulomonas wangleii]QVI63104.1 C40 family peptidase [Cellulomonas wangleii]
MSDCINQARHRAARRPSTPLTELANAASEQMGTVGRRTAVVAASSGLMVSMIAVPSYATDRADTPALAAVDTAALTASARAVLNTSPVVASPAEAVFTVDAPVIVAEKPAPPPEPEPEPVRTRSTARTAERAATTETTQAPASNPVPQSVSGNAVLEIAARYVGVPYVSGGSTPDGFDCSGFTSYVYAQLGISLPRTSSAQRNAGTVVSRADAQPGDLIWSPGHIGIYAGGNQMIDAPRPGKTVQFRNIWQSNPTFIRVG